MKIFLSWSQEDSKQVAKALKIFLLTIFEENLNPWVSDEDIGVGDRWFKVLTSALNDANFAILCLTPANQNSAWMMFEAGAVSKLQNKSLIVPFLFGFSDYSLMPEPFKQFQACEANSVGVKKLVEKINEQMGDYKIRPQIALDALFDAKWTAFEKSLKVIEPIELKAPQIVVEKQIVEMPPTPNSIYESMVELFGVGHKKVVFSCDIDIDGSARFRREVEVEALIGLDSLDTFLLINHEESESIESNLELPEIASGDNNLTVNLDNIKLFKSTIMEVPFLLKQPQEPIKVSNRLTCEIRFDPPLIKGDKTKYFMSERNTTRIFLDPLDPEDSFGWGVYRPTRALELCVTLPKGYEPIKPYCKISRVASQGFPKEQERTKLKIMHDLRPIRNRLSDGRFKLRLNIDHPMVGMAYRICWTNRPL